MNRVLSGPKIRGGGRNKRGMLDKWAALPQWPKGVGACGMGICPLQRQAQKSKALIVFPKNHLSNKL